MLGEQRKTVTELKPLLLGAGDSDEQAASRAFREALPPELVPTTDKDRAGFTQKLGTALKKHQDQVFGRLVLRLSVGHGHGGGRLWYVTESPLTRARVEVSPDFGQVSPLSEQVSPPESVKSEIETDDFGDTGDSGDTFVPLHTRKNAYVRDRDREGLVDSQEVLPVGLDDTLNSRAHIDRAKSVTTATKTDNLEIEGVENRGDTCSKSGDTCCENGDTLGVQAESVTTFDGANPPASVTSVTSVETPEYVYIRSATELTEILPGLLAAERLGVDTGQYAGDAALDPLVGHLGLVQLAAAGQPVVLVDMRTVEARLLDAVFDGQRTVVLHNASFDFGFLLRAGVDVRTNRILDTMLSEQVLQASAEPFSEKGRFSLASVVERRCGVLLPKEQQRSDWSGDLSAEQLEYAARDAAAVLRVADDQERELRDANLRRVAQLEGRATPAVAWLELSGVPIDTVAWVDRLG